MISIERPSTEPDPIKDAPEQGDLWNSPEVVDALWVMQHGKCCYCECSIPRSGQGQHVEHYRPKEDTRFRHLKNSWTNLMHACPQCNGWKGEQFPESGGNPMLIDPAAPRMNPQKHIEFTAGLVEDDVPGLPLERNGSRRGRKTIDVLRLHHPDHVRARIGHFKKEIQPVLERLADAEAADDAAALNSAIEDFRELLLDVKKYAGFARSIARKRGLMRLGIEVPGE